MTFEKLCALIIIGTMTMTYILAPVLWDAAGYVEDILNNVYHVEFSVVGPSNTP